MGVFFVCITGWQKYVANKAESVRLLVPGYHQKGVWKRNQHCHLSQYWNSSHFCFIKGWIFVKENKSRKTSGASLQQVTKSLFLFLVLPFSILQHPSPLRQNCLFILPFTFCPTENVKEAKNCLTSKNWFRPVNQLLALIWFAFFAKLN